MPITKTRAAIAAAAALALTTTAGASSPPEPATAAPPAEQVPDVQPAHLPAARALPLGALQLRHSPTPDVRAALVAREARTGMGQRPASRAAVRQAEKARAPERAAPARRVVKHRQAAKHRTEARHRAASSRRAPAARHGLAGVLAFARAHIGERYGAGGWDCSSFTQAAYRSIGVHLPRQSGAQRAAGTVVSRSKARPGDLVWWPGHVGIYAGRGRVVDAGNSRTDVSERGLWGSPTFVRIT